MYRARDARLEREVAVKALPTGFSSDPERLHRFIREAKVLASLNHPNISAIYGLEELPSGERLLVLELIEGETLAERLKRGALAIPEVLRVCGAIAEALEAAHERGVIHRDLKPGNVMLTPRGVVKVLDFGLARRSEVSLTDRATGAPTVTALTEVGQVIGTPGYMSPEHVRGEEHDRRTDIFAFGCVLFECLTGRRAFGGATKMDAIAAVLNAEPPWSLLPRDAPQPIRGLLARCLEKDPRQRLRDIGDARIEIEEAREARPPARAPVSATQHNLPKQLTSFVGREREIAECDALLASRDFSRSLGSEGAGRRVWRSRWRIAGSRRIQTESGSWTWRRFPIRTASPCRGDSSLGPRGARQAHPRDTDAASRREAHPCRVGQLRARAPGMRDPFGAALGFGAGAAAACNEPGRPGSEGGASLRGAPAFGAGTRHGERGTCHRDLGSGATLR